MSSKYDPEEYIDQLHKELDEYKAELTRCGDYLTTFQRLARERGDKLSDLKRDYAMLQKGMCGTNAELSMAWHKMDLLKAELKATYELLDVYEKENERLRKGLTVALDSVQWMADATDADPEDRERLAFVVKALMEGEYGE